MLDVPSVTLPPTARGTAPALLARASVVLHSVLHTLAYADIFDYPLTAPEVKRYLTATKASLEDVARTLTDERFFAQVGDYFTLRGREQIVDTRKRRANVAVRMWPKAARYGRIIAGLPFVRMVAVTGSLSMNNTDEGKDVDYLIITAPKHLWTCRALSLLVTRFAKLEGITLCPNYLVTTNALELEERSLYVAHELVQMIPLSGLEIYREMLDRNRWLQDYLPNALTEPEMPQGVKQLLKRSVLQRILEFLFAFPFASWFEKWEMNRKIARLSREQSASFESYFSADVCKGHIDRHGENVGTALAVRLANVNASHQTAETVALKERLIRLDQAR